MKKIIAVILIFALCCNLTAFSAFAEDDTRVEVVIDTKNSPSPISPYIYGLVTEDGVLPERVNSAKQGNTNQILYNWEQNFSNNGTVNYVPGTPEGYPAITTPGYYPEEFAHNASETEQRFITLPSAGYAAADDDGAVRPGDSSRFHNVYDNKPTELLTEPDISDDMVYNDEFIAYLVNKFGYAVDGGISGYFLDRQPETHRDLFPFLSLPRVTAAGLTTRHINTAKTVKRIDSSALVMGPSVKNLESYVNLKNTADWNEHSTEWDWFVDYYLDRFASASESAGTRLLDVLDLHFYTEAVAEGGIDVLLTESETVREAREAAPRIFWDATYTEASKSSLSFKSKIPLLTTLKASIDIYYPGTELSFSEYAFGGGGDISGGIAAADALGIFGREGVYSANMYTSDLLYGGDNTYELSALRLYTDFDGAGGAFGSTSVSCDLGADRMASAYAATEGGDPNMTVIYMNKNLTEDQTVMFSLYSDADYSTASIYGFSDGKPDIKYFKDFTISGNSFNVLVPAQTVYLFKISGKLRDGIETTIVTGENGEWVTEVVPRTDNVASQTTFATTIVPDETLADTESGYVSHIPAESDDETDREVPLFLKVIVISVAAAVVISIFWVLFNIKKI